MIKNNINKQLNPYLYKNLEHALTDRIVFDQCRATKTWLLKVNQVELTFKFPILPQRQIFYYV